ncbi:3-dehydroquinate synthase [Desulfatibacillum aliphaticivorans]|uniref:3-dehydroquinate synthase n=1 Tax=Desulfatibacillum aliphaticivorans TaxID=218208 RepID=UPI0003F86BD4|nr:3-dehydroquinate synthase [Desulfatibacillum aliphaticivorans]
MEEDNMVRELKISGKTGNSRIMVGEALKNLGLHLPKGKTVIITDETVNDLYGNLFPACPVLEIGEGEGNKTLDTVARLMGELVGLGLDRSCFIVGIGGGIVCDVTGFVASTYLRGVDFGFCPTTLLAQVDASVGGKNGVNYKGYKNMVGVFNQPSFVLCDPKVLKSLPQDELTNGFAEIVKHGAIRDESHFTFLEDNKAKALSLDSEFMAHLIYDSIAIKADVVNQDEKETGIRKILNFGHTFGHALEKTAGVSHGKAVSAGMVMACNLSMDRGLLKESDSERIKKLLKDLGLPLRIEVDPAKALDALAKDKKKLGDAIQFVLLKALGEAVVETISIRDLETNLG